MLPQSKGIGQQPIVTIAVTKKREQHGMCGTHFCLPPELRKIDICVQRNQYKKKFSVHLICPVTVLLLSRITCKA